MSVCVCVCVCAMARTWYAGRGEERSNVSRGFGMRRRVSMEDKKDKKRGCCNSKVVNSDGIVKPFSEDGHSAFGGPCSFQVRDRERD